MKTFFLVYVSSAVKPFTPQQLVDLLSQSRAKNAGLGITGMLLYKDGNFMQVLEGQETAVRSLYATIDRDPRHRNVMMLLQGEIDSKQFAEWSMGFRDLSAADLHRLPGYSEFLNTPLTSAEFSADPTRCQRLLTVFKQSM